ncbi:hypothetical protein EON63_23675 [archaeon]|nr:MAG: hypothetical protein EON63_23675 [archaeon]
MLFTASQKVYADTLVDIIDPQHTYIQHRLFRESCLCVQGTYLKDLQVLGRDMKKVRELACHGHEYGHTSSRPYPYLSSYPIHTQTNTYPYPYRRCW